jgi:xylulokinase
MALIGLDIGTTSCKTHIFNESLQLLISISREYSVDFPHPQWAEQDPEAVWMLAKECLREGIKKAGVADSVKAIGLSVQGEAVTPVDKEGNALRPMILGMDTRTDKQNQWLVENLGARELYNLTGMPVHSINTLPKLLWLKENEPAIWKAADRFLLYEDFIINKLTGNSYISKCLASRTQLYDLKNEKWSEKLLEILGIHPEKLAKIKPSGFPVGQVKTDLADELELKTRPVVATGGHDQACGALGSGITQAGLAMVSSGTAEVVEVGIDEPCLNDALYKGNMSVYQHTCPGLYLIMTLNQSGGFILRWFRDVFCQPEVERAMRDGLDAYDLVLGNTDNKPSPVMLLPHFAGSGTPTFDTHSKGAILGLTFATNKGDIAKAILEGLTMELRLNLEFLRAGGIYISELRAIGGGAKSEFWLQLKADITGIPVAVPQVNEAAGMGAAILAGVAEGLFSNPAAVINKYLKIRTTYYPNAEKKALYDQRYQTYQELYPALKEINHKL